MGLSWECVAHAHSTARYTAAVRIVAACVGIAALGVFGLLALRTAGGASNASDSLASQVAGEERQIADLERRANALLRAPAPPVPGAASQAPLYLGGGGEFPRLDEHQRLDARHLMLVELERGGVTEVDYDDGSQVTRIAPPWEKAGFVVAPVEVLLAIRVAATQPFKNVELDLRVATASRGIHFVTLVHELDGRLLVTDIPATSLPPQPPRPVSGDAEVRKRFGIGRLDGGEGKWSAQERQSLERALALLSDRELAQIRDLELRRESRPRRVLPFKGACGLTVVERTERWIEIYDCAFRDDDIVFVGSPKAPERASVRLILHEIGHAVASGPVRAFNRDLQRLADDGKKTTTEYLELRAHASAAGQRSLDEIAAPLTKIAARLQALARFTADAHSAGPAVAAFSRLPGAASGITSYGREGPAEAFAEAFSLFHADPDALRRVSPEALEFFERGGHLASDD